MVNSSTDPRHVITFYCSRHHVLLNRRNMYVAAVMGPGLLYPSTDS